MLFERVFFCFSLLHFINPHLQINLHLTNLVSEDNNLQHDCLQVPSHTEEESDPRQIISYCMSEWPSKFHIKENNFEQKFTFEQLSKQKITSQQLYLWSAPIDLIEQYQFYLNQLQKSKKMSLSTQIFYNCTLPYFGPQCQYILPNSTSYHSSLTDIIHEYYYSNQYQPTLFTCYMHLKCNRGLSPSCLDWTEICDGKLDCLDGDYDEEHCWKLEIFQDNEDEYQHFNGYCIPQAFYRYDMSIADCVYQSNQKIIVNTPTQGVKLDLTEPSFRYEDMECSHARRDNRFSYLTASCVSERKNLLLKSLSSIKPNSLSNECWTAMKCIMHMPIDDDKICQKFCSDNVCNNIIQMTCPDIIIVPAVPVLFGHVYLAYEKNKSYYRIQSPASPQYPCYNYQLFQLPINNKSLMFFNDTACGSTPNLIYPGTLQRGVQWSIFIQTTYLSLNKFHSPVLSDHRICNTLNMYQCFNSSKCISKNRLTDGVIDCLYHDDEENSIGQPNIYTALLVKNCSSIPNLNYFRCAHTNECVRKLLVQNGRCDCTAFDDGLCDDEHFVIPSARNTILFQTICDNFIHLSSTSTKDQNETDETNCDEWPLIHVYNRCDGFWHYLDGLDEVNCDLSPPLLNCSINHHICVSPKTNELMCLPIEKANDKIIDCLGAADEPTLCRNNLYNDMLPLFYCNLTYEYASDCQLARYMCDKEPFCEKNEDEQACNSHDLSSTSFSNGICTGNYESYGSDVAKILCRHFTHSGLRWKIDFTLDQSQNLNEKYRKQGNSLSYQFTKQNVERYQPRCHRGIDLQVWLDKEKKITTNICLCPPSYYGEICQYQNQRISLVLRFHVSSDSVHIPFIIIVSLIDNTNQRIIHSYEQFTYLSMQNCQKPFNIILLYSTRPKDETKHYSIQIDIYEKKKLVYRGSTIKSLNFSFLPVHRLIYTIDIPPIDDHMDDCSNTQCINGKCRKYFNDRNNRTFCQCKEGSSGQFCTIPFISNCSSDALFLGKLANNRSLCICPVNKIGPQCLINDPACQNTTCMNKGECISLDEYEISTKKFICLCPKEFTGDQCEINRTKLILIFHKTINLSSPIFIHFIEAKFDAAHVRTTTMKTINSFEQQSIIIYRSLPFHVAFVELENKTYYLIYIQKISRQSLNIEKLLNSSDQCLHINKLFNKTLANSSLLHRIKYYHLLCQTNRSELLKCFYDEIQFCFCQQLDQQFDQQRVANCFRFNHNMSLYCSGPNICENEGQCFQEYTTCPRVSICQCSRCFYGTRCQLSTNGFSLSLDAILGYHIRSNLNISHQPLAVIISLILTVIITLLGLTNGILSFITFKHENTRESGCGIYLLTSSIITLLIMILFLLKFFILLFSQMGSIINRLFLKIQCHSIDFLLRSSLIMDQWLTAFVAIERALIVIKGIYFNKKKSKLIAKWIIFSLTFIIILTNIHDPIYRKLFDEENNNNDDDENKIWCIVKYPSAAIRIISLIINFLHFIIPFIINLICAIIIIWKSTHLQAVKQKKKRYQELLNEQIQQHKNLLIGPCVLIILGIPRLIISFTSGCMKSPSNSWLFLLGYFISLIPSLLTFILFILPSTTYKDTFRKAIRQYRNLCNRHS